ncbi:MAG: TIGR00296 family protein [Candidatus Thermoplasmatota archaeon]|nr:TIGR00296 family protein [Candidatus Thermoplasmatota archaeon]
MYSEEEGRAAVNMARAVIDAHVMKKEFVEPKLPPSFENKGGAFVTVETFPARNLRGCIGYPYPIFKLKKTVIDSARSAVSSDYRFRPVTKDELDRITVEVSLLTTPEKLEPKKRKELLKTIVVGRDGLMVEKGAFKGLLLPQVPTEWGWDVRTFLEETCMKARLSANSWLDEDVKIYRYSAQVFRETTPRGEIEREELVR